MSELRRDPLTDEWVAIVGHRQARPDLTEDVPAAGAGCPFCPGGLEAPGPYEVRAFENRWPPLTPGEPPDLRNPAAPARGAAEVVLYSPAHDGSLATIGVAGARRVVDLWAERTTALIDRPEVEYVLVFENRGAAVGATIPHPHGQIYAFPFVPPVPARELDVARARGCTLCRATRDEADAGARVVRDADGWLTYVPFASGYPFGVIVAPLAHIDALPSADGAARTGLAAALVDAVGRYDRLFGRELAYLMWLHQLPGDGAAHLHVHFAPPARGPDALRYVASGEVGSGTLSNPVVPEDAARMLRDA